MSLSITAEPEFWGLSLAWRSFSEVRLVERKHALSPFLISVWVVIALGVVVMFEPSPSDIGISLVFVGGFFGRQLRWDQRLTLPYTLLGDRKSVV